MTNKTKDPWTEASTWQIVWVDLDLEHVFSPTGKITFQPEGGGFRVAPEGQTKLGECFQDTLLERAGSLPPTLNDIEGVQTLANFQALDAEQSSKILDKLAEHLDHNEDLLRLEGTIEILCHETDTQLAAPPRRPAHAPLRVPTKICVYQINDAGTPKPFLLIRAPLSPACPVNGSGTVAGQS